MQNRIRLAEQSLSAFALALMLSLAAGCHSKDCCLPTTETKTSSATTPASSSTSASSSKSTSASTPASASMSASTSTPATTTPTAPPPPVRIKAGPGGPFKDADGNTWIPEQGISEGDTTERPDLTIANTKTPVIYLSEHYSMTGFSYPVPNGKYTVKLHFAETYEGITGPGERVFDFNVEGHQFDKFDIWVKSGGFCRAYIETVDVDVTDGKLDITFKEEVEHPQICGIEILPAK